MHWPPHGVALCRVRAPRRAAAAGPHGSRGRPCAGTARWAAADASVRVGRPAAVRADATAGRRAGAVRPAGWAKARTGWGPCTPPGTLQTPLRRGACHAERRGRVGSSRPCRVHGSAVPRAVGVAVGAGVSRCRMSHAAGALPSVTGAQASGGSPLALSGLSSPCVAAARGAASVAGGALVSLVTPRGWGAARVSVVIRAGCGSHAVGVSRLGAAPRHAGRHAKAHPVGRVPSPCGP